MEQFQEYFTAPTMRVSGNTALSINAGAMDPCLLQILQEEQQLMETLVAMVQAQQRQRAEIVKPDSFGESSGPED